MSSGLRVAGLFAGIGGIEAGLHRAGHETAFLCEYWEPARRVLAARFPSAPLVLDIRDLNALPEADVVTAGFPCTDLSQAGRTAGIDGDQSGLVRKALELVERHECTWLVLENVRNMLPLHGGRAMHAIVSDLERMGLRWAYRVVDSRFTGVPQRRQRVILVASRNEDPRAVLFADDAGERSDDTYAVDAYGFYWTEGLRGLGWARDAVPTLKGGSTIGIPSPPGVWLPGEELGRRVVTPGIGVAEALQGFRRGWTEAGNSGRRGHGARWKMTGNAVTVGVSSWLGKRLARPAAWDPTLASPLEPGERWPLAAYGEKGRAFRVSVSMWPQRRTYKHLTAVMEADYVPLSNRAASGFLARLERSNLRVDEQFRIDIKEHVEATRGSIF